MGLQANLPSAERAQPTELVMLVGRLRRWHRNREWGFIFSDLHNCDVFLDGNNVDTSATLSEGDTVMFELCTDEEGFPAARAARRASAGEVEQQQALLQPVYQQHGVPALQVSSSAVAVPSSGAVVPARDAAPQGMAPLVGSTTRHLGNLGRAPPPPPPPPPSHPAPTGPSDFAPQALCHAGMHQQPYMAHNCFGGYPGYNGPWPNGSDALLSVGGTPTAMASQVMGHRLMLECPQMLEKLDPKALVAVLKGGPPPRRRAQTFRSSRTGTASQIGQEWCEVLRQACALADQQSAESDRQQQQQHVQPAAANNWPDAQWPQQLGSYFGGHQREDAVSLAHAQWSDDGNSWER